MRLIIAAAVGTIVVFLWSVLSWTVLDFWSDQIQPLPAEHAAAVTDAASKVPASGAYELPGRPDADRSVEPAERDAAERSWQDAIRSGPAGVLLVHPGGFEPAGSSRLFRNLLLEFAGAILLAVMLGIASRAGAGYAGRLGVGVAAIAFAVVAGVLVPGNLMVHPSGWTRALAGDMILGWGLALLVMAAIVRVPRRSGRYARS